jgi:hypothetical protein
MSEPKKQIREVLIEFPDGTIQTATIQLPTSQVDNLDDSIIWKNFNDAATATEMEERE